MPSARRMLHRLPAGNRVVGNHESDDPGRVLSRGALVGARGLVDLGALDGPADRVAAEPAAARSALVHLREHGAHHPDGRLPEEPRSLEPLEPVPVKVVADEPGGVESTVAQHRPAVELKLVEDPVDFVQREVLLAFEDSLDDSIDLGRIDVPVEAERQETNVLPAVVRLANRGREEVFSLLLRAFVSTSSTT